MPHLNLIHKLVVLALILAGFAWFSAAVASSRVYDVIGTVVQLCAGIADFCVALLLCILYPGGPKAQREEDWNLPPVPPSTWPTTSCAPGDNLPVKEKNNG